MSSTNRKEGITNVSISPESAFRLVSLLMERGYFDASPSQSDDEQRIASQLILTKDRSRYLTRTCLTNKLQNDDSMEASGRLSKHDAAMLYNVDPNEIQQCMSSLRGISTVGDDFVKPAYFHHQLTTIALAVQQAGGCIRLSEIATHVLALPLAVVSFALSLRVQELEQEYGIRMVTASGGIKLLQTRHYQVLQRRQLQGALEALTGPTLIESLVQYMNSLSSSTNSHHHYWDAAYLIARIQELPCEELGVLHQESSATCTSTSSAALYSPTIYTTLQRQTLVQQFHATGILTVEQCRPLGIRRLHNRVDTMLLEETFSNAAVLEHVILDSERIVNPILPILQQAILEQSFADLRMHLPEPLLIHADDVITVVTTMALPLLQQSDATTTSQPGQVVCSCNEALFVSQGMKQSLITRLIPPLVEAHAKERAQLLFQEGTQPLEKGALEEPVSTSKRGKKTKRSTNTTTVSTKTHLSHDLVPLRVVALAVLEAFPDLKDLQQSYGTFPSSSNLPWEPENEEESALDYNSPVLDLCRQTIYDSAFQDSCRGAVNAELERLESTKKAASVLNRKEGATKIRSVENSFEDPACFAAACHQLCLHARFLDYAVTCDIASNELELLRSDFLRSVCADFASRITQYCLFKNELEGDIFQFQDCAADANQQDAPALAFPPYCQPVHRAARRFPRPFLSCIQSEERTNSKPLPTMRKVLSGNLGVMLARLWSHCGGLCYDGGVETKPDGTVYVRPGNIEDFMAFVEENCLSICGMPFKKLDKKSEKQYLFARRQEMSATLEASTDATSVLELTVMLLFQQLQGVVVSGSHLGGPVLNLLLKEKKLTAPVAELLCKLREATLSNDVASDETVIAKVKVFGLSRDIHKVELGVD